MVLDSQVQFGNTPIITSADVEGAGKLFRVSTWISPTFRARRRSRFGCAPNVQMGSGLAPDNARRTQEATKARGRTKEMRFSGCYALPTELAARMVSDQVPEVILTWTSLERMKGRGHLCGAFL